MRNESGTTAGVSETLIPAATAGKGNLIKGGQRNSPPFFMSYVAKLCLVQSRWKWPLTPRENPERKTAKDAGALRAAQSPEKAQPLPSFPANPLPPWKSQRGGEQP